MTEKTANQTSAKPKDTRPWFKKKRFIIPAALLGIGIIGSQFNDSESASNSTSSTTSKSSNDKTEETENTVSVTSASTTSTSSTTDEKTSTDKTKEQLKRELASLDKPLNLSTYKGSIPSVQMGLVLFGVYSGIIKEGKNSAGPENQKLAEQLEKKVIAKQVKALPQLRKNYAEAAAEKLWENNIYVTVGGSGNSIINLSGGVFANNKNIAESQRTLQDILTQFRFKEVRYRWYKEADEFTYYKLDTPKDNVLFETN